MRAFRTFSHRAHHARRYYAVLRGLLLQTEAATTGFRYPFQVLAQVLTKCGPMILFKDNGLEAILCDRLVALCGKLEADFACRPAFFTAPKRTTFLCAHMLRPQALSNLTFPPLSDSLFFVEAALGVVLTHNVGEKTTPMAYCASPACHRRAEFRNQPALREAAQGELWAIMLVVALYPGQVTRQGRYPSTRCAHV